MKTVDPSALRDTKVYFIEADRNAQRRARLNRQALEEKLRLLCLLNERVVIGASHIFESDSTYRTLLNNRLLLERGLIVPTLWDTCRDFKDFLN